jgi:hypothetical protein
MKTFSRLLLVVSLAAGATGCFDGPNGIPGNHRSNDAPIVIPDTPATLSSGDFDITWTAYDPDSNFVMIWDECPFEALEGATPILRVGFSTDGTNFSPIDPAHLELDGAPLVVPSCKQVKKFDDSVRIAVSTSGEQHTFTWSSLTYIPTAAQVTFRVAVNDGSFTSEPGDTDPFPLANQPGFSIEPFGARPGQTVSAEFSGLLTTWGGTTLVTTGGNLSVANFTATSTTAATADLTMGPDTDQVIRTLELVTPGAGLPSGDESALGTMWTCNVLGQPVVEFETENIGDVSQYICDQGTNWGITGDLTEGDGDFFSFVANSAGDAAVSLDWNSSDGGDVTDYDLFVIDPDVGLSVCEDSFTGCDCASVAKPELCTLSGLTPGGEYLVYISHYAGGETDYTLTIGAGP